MARYRKDFPLTTSPDAIFQTVYQYLIFEGYEYLQYDHENVFKKGHGLMTGPTFLKLSFSENAVRLEAWMKYALLPGVYVGEIGLTSFIGAAVKGPLKRRVAQIEEILAQYAATPAATYEAQATPDQPEYFFCTNCGTKLPQGTAFCPNCGHKTTDSSQHMQTPQE